MINNSFRISDPESGRGHTVGFAMRIGNKYGQVVVAAIIQAVLYAKLYNYIVQLNEGLKKNTSKINLDQTAFTIRKFIFYPCKK